MASHKAKQPSPISNSLLGRMFRASPEGLVVLVRSVPPETRAMLAVYCLRNERLRSIGLAIAATCKRRDLLCQGGSAILDLIQKLKGPETVTAGNSAHSVA